METRIAVTPSEDSVIHPQVLLQCYSGFVYLPVSYDPNTRLSVFEIRGDIPPAALQILEQQLTLRGAVFEIFEVEVIAVTELEAEVEDVDEFEDQYSDEVEEPVLLEDDCGTRAQERGRLWLARK